MNPNLNSTLLFTSIRLVWYITIIGTFTLLCLSEPSFSRKPSDVKPTARRGGRKRRQQLVSVASRCFGCSYCFCLADRTAVLARPQRCLFLSFVEQKCEMQNPSVVTGQSHTDNMWLFMGITKRLVLYFDT